MIVLQIFLQEGDMIIFCNGDYMLPSLKLNYGVEIKTHVELTLVTRKDRTDPYTTWVIDQWDSRNTERQSFTKTIRNHSKY